MALYKVLKPFKDIETKEVYEASQEIEITVKRAEAVENNLAKHGGGFLERVNKKEPDAALEAEEPEEAKGANK